jgi:lysophospholipase L1-like esterase
MSFTGMSDTEIVEVMIFGDSITYGAWDNNGGWVQRLREPIDVKNLVNPDVAYFIYNLGVVDDTTSGIVKRFDAEMAARKYVNAVQDKIVIFSAGLNDSEVLLKKNSNRVPEREFKENVYKLIELASKHTKHIVFIGPTPVDEAKAEPVPWDIEKAYRNDIAKRYDNIMKIVCKEKNVHFIELFDYMMSLDYKSLLEDGLHPSPAGHLVIYEAVRKFLENNKILNFGMPRRL